MTPIDSALIQLECTRLLHLYLQLTDARDYEALVQLYTEDGVFCRPTAPDEPIVGRAAILAAYLARPPRVSRHVCANPVITPDGPDRATGSSYLLLYTAAWDQEGLPAADGKMLVGGFKDIFVRENGVWKFSDRRGSLALSVGAA